MPAIQDKLSVNRLFNANSFVIVYLFCLLYCNVCLYDQIN